MNVKYGVMLAVLVGLAIVLYSSSYIVDETQQVIITPWASLSM